MKMTEEKLTEFLHRIVVSDDPAAARNLVMQVMTPLMAAGGDHCVSGAMTLWNKEKAQAVTVALEYVIHDKSLVDLAWRKACVGELQLEPVRRASLERALAAGLPPDGDLPEGKLDGGIVGDGVVVLFRERPVLMIIAVGGDRLEVQVGGFENSIVAHPGNLMDLQRQVIEQLPHSGESRGTRNSDRRGGGNG